MDKVGLRCRSCGRFGSQDCPGAAESGDSCASYVSWSEHWTQEMALIERALRNTYIAAACFAILAAATLLMPSTFG